MSDWTPRTREHTFTTGRSATLREQLPLKDLVRRGTLQVDALEAWINESGLTPEQAVSVADAVVLGMFVDPRISLNGETGDGVVPIAALDEDEINETVELAFESVAGAAGFRRDEPGAGDRGDGARLGDEAERPARPATRKPGGARRGPKTSRAARSGQ